MNEDGALLLERRAAALARPVELAHPTATMQVLVLAVAGGHRYAVESRYVDQVAHNARLCRLPASPGQLLGLLPVRGEAVPVTDLAALAGVAAADGTVLLDVDTLLADPRVSYFPHAELSPDAATSD